MLPREAACIGHGTQDLPLTVWDLTSLSARCHWAAGPCLHPSVGHKISPHFQPKWQAISILSFTNTGGVVPNLLFCSLVCISIHRVPRQRAFHCLNHAISPYYFLSRSLHGFGAGLTLRALTPRSQQQFSYRSPKALDQAHKEEYRAKKFQTEALEKLIKCRMPVFAAGKDQLPCLVLLIKSLQTIKAAEGRKTELSFPAPQPASLHPSMNFIKHKSPSRHPSAIGFLLMKYSGQMSWLSWREREMKGKICLRVFSKPHACNVKSPPARRFLQEHISVG